MKGQRLTQKFVDQVAPEGRDFVIWDRDLKGFGLKVTAGGKKVYVVQYRQGGRGAPTKRRTLGADGSPWTAATARVEAMRLLHWVGLGHDPAEEEQTRKRENVELRFDAFAERFLDLYAAREWGPRTYRNHDSNIRRWIVPVLRSKSIAQLTRRDITEVLDALPRTGPALERNIFVLMRRMFNWAVERGDIAKSPMSGMKVPKKAPERHHILSDYELVCVSACTMSLSPLWAGFVQLLILTGQRLREVAEMDWSELSQSDKLWVIPGARTKNARNHNVPISSVAARVLDALAGSAEWPKRGFVFSHKKDRPISGFSKMKREFDRILQASASSAPAPWRLHDLRRTVATNLQRLGVRFEVTEAILNHVSVTQAGVISVYQRHDWADEKRDALEAWAKRFLAMLDEWENADEFSSRLERSSLLTG